MFRKTYYRKICFLSHMISERMPHYAGKKSTVLKKTMSIKRGDPYNEMNWSFSNHIGTHIDTPLHSIEGGLSVTDYKPADWIFDKIALVEIRKVKPGYIIKSEDITNLKDCELLLVKTGFEKYRNKKVYWQNSPTLHPELARFIKKECPFIKAIGIDFLSISNLNHQKLGVEIHKSFLGNKILLIEDLALSSLEGIPEAIIVMPIQVEKADGAPCTVLAFYLKENCNNPKNCPRRPI